MPIGDFFGALRRRWLLVLVGVLLTAGLSGGAYWFFKPTYEVTGTVLLLPPPSSAANGSSNPYLQLGGLQQAVDLVGVSLSDQASQLEMKDISKDVEFTVKADVQTSSPLLVIDVKDSSPDTAIRIRDLLVARVPVQLESMQQSLSVSPKDRVTSTVVTLDAQALEVGRNRLRAGVLAGVLGLGLTMVVAAMWDARKLRQSPRRASEAPVDAATPTAEPGEPLLPVEDLTEETDLAGGSPADDTDVSPAESADARTGEDVDVEDADELPLDAADVFRFDASQGFTFDSDEDFDRELDEEMSQTQGEVSATAEDLTVLDEDLDVRNDAPR